MCILFYGVFCFCKSKSNLCFSFKNAENILYTIFELSGQKVDKFLQYKSNAKFSSFLWTSIFWIVQQVVCFKAAKKLIRAKLYNSHFCNYKIWVFTINEIIYKFSLFIQFIYFVFNGSMKIFCSNQLWKNIFIFNSSWNNIFF